MTGDRMDAQGQGATALEFGRRAPKSGTARQMVIFLHGYGADGADLLGLADPLSGHMPDAVFIAPNAPNRCSLNPMGYEWFPIPWIDGSSEEAARAGMVDAIARLDAFLDQMIVAEGIAAADTVLVGFSQGTMMSLHVGPRRTDCLAGIVGFSGRLLEPGRLAAEAVTRPPVMLIHGDADDVVPPSSLGEAADALSAAGFEVHTHVSKGMGHGIAPDGLGMALAFMKKVLRLES